MSGKNIIDGKGIDARLDRSLRNQVKVPKLGKSFDAAVWARIAAEEASAGATNPGEVPARVEQAARLMNIINFVGLAAMLCVALYFTLSSFGGIEAPAIDLGARVALPTLSNETLTRVLMSLGQVLGYATLVFGLSLTPFGRRWRQSFS